MPRFYFPSSDGHDFVPDEVGLELDGLAAARALAARALAEMAGECLAGAVDGHTLRVSVLNQTQRVLLDLTLTFALRTGEAGGGEERR